MALWHAGNLARRRNVWIGHCCVCRGSDPGMDQPPRSRKPDGTGGSGAWPTIKLEQTEGTVLNIVGPFLIFLGLGGLVAGVDAEIATLAARLRKFDTMTHDAFDLRVRKVNRALVRQLSWLSVFLLATMAYAQSSGPEFPNPGNAHMSRDDQRTLGLQAAAQVYQQMPVLPDNSPETQYVRQLGQKLVATIPSQYSWPFEFHVVAQKEINAFALPGGPMFVNIGTVTAATNEAQLAGVMAHEMSHVYMQHSAKQAGKTQTMSALAGLAGAILGATTDSTLGSLAQAGIRFGAEGLILKYSRGDEAQADAVGAIIMYKAGYNPQAMADFFKTLESEGGEAPPQWLSDHPNPGNRQLAIQKEIQNWPPENYITSSPAFAKVREEAKGVKSYTVQEIAEGAKSGQWASLNLKNGATFTPTGATRKSPVPVAAAGSAPSGAP